MSTRDLYQETIGNMRDLLQHTISDFYGAYDAVFNHYNSQPIFSITSREFELLKRIEHFSNFQTRNTLALLCRKLLSEFGFHVSNSDESSDVDFYVLCGSDKIGYYVSMQEMGMPNLTQAVAAGMTKHIVIVLKSNLIMLPNNSYKYRAYPHKQLTSCISLEEFFNSVSPGEYEVFKEYIGQFNYDAEMMLGLAVSPIPTQKAIQKKHEKIIAELNNFFYRHSLPNSFTTEEVDFLRERFSNIGIGQISSAPFIDSFISSEWYFDLLLSTDGEMEQTAIVAGYLKAIEQFLFALMLSKCDTLQFKLKTQKDGKIVALTKENKSSLLTMANNLLTSIDINYGKKMDAVYVNEIIGTTVQEYLHDFFTHTRNGYFHKDNLYSLQEIKAIRERAYCAFFLLASSFLFDIEALKAAL